MKQQITTSDGQHNKLIINAETNISVNPEKQNAKIGKSVGYTLTSNENYWFAIRATHNRARKVYEKLISLKDNALEPYLPIIKKANSEEILNSSLLFLRCTLQNYKQLLEFSAAIPGLTPHYNHFFTNEYGKNEFLVVPDHQIKSLRIILESNDENIIVDQAIAPHYLSGDNVEVIDGTFAGVKGILLKYKHQKRVFVDVKGVGCFGTAYVPGAWLRRIEN